MTGLPYTPYPLGHSLRPPGAVAHNNMMNGFDRMAIQQTQLGGGGGGAAQAGLSTPASARTPSEDMDVGPSPTAVATPVHPPPPSVTHTPGAGVEVFKLTSTGDQVGSNFLQPPLQADAATPGPFHPYGTETFQKGVMLTSTVNGGATCMACRSHDVVSVGYC